MFSGPEQMVEELKNFPVMQVRMSEDIQSDSRAGLEDGLHLSVVSGQL